MLFDIPFSGQLKRCRESHFIYSSKCHHWKKSVGIWSHHTPTNSGQN